MRRTYDWNLTDGRRAPCYSPRRRPARVEGAAQRQTEAFRTRTLTPALKPQDKRSRTFLADGHDHGVCITLALGAAAELCTKRGARLTTLRRRVLEIVWQSHKPLGAYGILEVLSADGRCAAPPTVYRALDFLVAHGLVHKLASLNAFVGCPAPGHAGTGQFLICRRCGVTAEVDDQEVEAAIDNTAAAHGFRPIGHMVEISGLCPNCAAQAASPEPG